MASQESKEEERKKRVYFELDIGIVLDRTGKTAMRLRKCRMKAHHAPVGKLHEINELQFPNLI